MERNLSIDILKFICAFFVVALHCHIFEDISTPLSYLFVQGITRTAVPIFLIINGFYFCKTVSRGQILRQLTKLVFLYVIWMIIYLYFWGTFDVKQIIKTLIFGYRHLWYIIGAVYALIIVWMLRKYTVVLITVSILCGIAGIILQYNSNYHFLPFEQSLGLQLYRNGLFFCLPFISTGYFMNKYLNHLKLLKSWMLIASSAVCFFIEIVVNYKYSNNGNFDILLSLYFICPVIFMYTLNRNAVSNNKQLSLYSTGIYLTHILFLNFLNRFIPLNSAVLCMTVFILSFVATYVILKIRTKYRYAKYLLN